MEKKHGGHWRLKGRISGFFRACIVALLLIMQILFIIDLALWLRENTIYYYAIVEIASFLIIVGLVNDKRSDSYKIGWIIIVLLMPVSGHIMYLLWGQSASNPKEMKRFRKAEANYLAHRDFHDEMLENYKNDYPGEVRLARYLESRHFPLTKNNQTQYFAMGEDAFEAIFADMRKAKRFILINFYIVSEGQLWETAHEIMKEKVKEGVEVLFLYDDFGTMFRTDKEFKDKLAREGIQVHVFNPIHKYTGKLYMNYRSHQKQLVVDGEIGYTGGINLADEYANITRRFGVWKDVAIRVQGDAAWEFTCSFLKMWEATSALDEVIDYEKYRPQAFFAENDHYCQVFTDGPDSEDNTAESVYNQLTQLAGRYLYATTPYLILDAKLRESLIIAAKSGVDVRIITPAIPDKKTVKLLTNYNYGQLLKGGVRIFEYQPGFIHAKIIMNEDCVVVGTINMDYRSFYLHYENGVLMTHPKIVDTIRADYEKTLQESKEITYEEWQKRPRFWKIVQPLLNLFATQM